MLWDSRAVVTNEIVEISYEAIVATTFICKRCSESWKGIMRDIKTNFICALFFRNHGKSALIAVTRSKYLNYIVWSISRLHWMSGQKSNVFSLFSRISNQIMFWAVVSFLLLILLLLFLLQWLLLLLLLVSSVKNEMIINIEMDNITLNPKIRTKLQKINIGIYNTFYVYFSEHHRIILSMPPEGFVL